MEVLVLENKFKVSKRKYQKKNKKVLDKVRAKWYT